MQIYLVGGAVRDALLGIKVYDRDWVVVSATADQMLSEGYQQVGKDFPVFLHPSTKEEYALARTERKQGKGYHGFEVFADPSVTLEEDLIRRDLTINAMAKTESGDIIDLYGGQEDLESRILRHVSSAFSEDPLRVLRVARFAAKLADFGFELAPETHALMRDMVASGELSELTPERVWQEMVKVFSTSSPRRFFEVLDSVGALAVLFPELKALEGVEQSSQYHPEGDAWIHTLMVLDQACQQSTVLSNRFAALVHDVGKGLTPKKLWPKHHGHEKAGLPLVKRLCQRYRVPKKVELFALKVTEFHGLIHQALDKQGKVHLRAETFHKVLHQSGAYKNRDEFEQILLSCQADARGRLGFENVEYAQLNLWLSVLDTASQVDNQAIIAQGYQGKEIAEQIERTRIQNIQTYIDELKNLSDSAEKSKSFENS